MFYFSPTLRIILIGLCLLLFIWYKKEKKLLILYTTLFLIGLLVNVGVQIDPLKIIMIFSMLASSLHLITLNYKVTFHFISCMKTFIIYALVVFVIGYIYVPRLDSSQGVAQNSVFHPIIEMAVLFILLYLIVLPSSILVNEIQTRNYLEKMCRITIFWSLVGIFQELWFLFFKSSIWAISNTKENIIITPTIVMGGLSYQRVNGLTWEAKSFGISIFMALGYMLFLKSRNIYLKLIVCSLAILFSFSGTSYVALIIAITSYLFFAAFKTKESETLKKLFVFIISLFLIFLCIDFVFPGSLNDLYSFRGEKTITLLFDTNNSDYGQDKEAPAIRFLKENPFLAITGVGIGFAPFYYEKYVTEDRGEYQEVDSGFLWAIYSFGLIGIILLIIGLKNFLRLEFGHLNIDSSLSIFLCICIGGAMAHRVAIPWLFLAVGILTSPGFKAYWFNKSE